MSGTTGTIIRQAFFEVPASFSFQDNPNLFCVDYQLPEGQEKTLYVNRDRFQIVDQPGRGILQLRRMDQRATLHKVQGYARSNFQPHNMESLTQAFEKVCEPAHLGEKKYEFLSSHKESLNQTDIENLSREAALLICREEPTIEELKDESVRVEIQDQRPTYERQPEQKKRFCSCSNLIQYVALPAVAIACFAAWYILQHENWEMGAFYPRLGNE